MKIVDKPIEWLRPYEKNPRNNEQAVEAVANSIKEFGFKVPIVATIDGEIVNGHTRFKAAKFLKLKTVPVLIADDLTEEQIKAFRLADNKTGELADWDVELLYSELDELTGFDMTMFGFEDIDFSLDDFEEDEENLKEMTKSELISYIKTMQDASPTTIFYEDKPVRNDIHPTMKPLKLIARCVLNSSKKGDKILDSFNGGGSTLMVCERSERIGYAMELDPVYVERTIKRWEEETGLTAEKVS
ncbi:ParB N-terminal domain-containing protein [Streptococcus sp. 5004]|uniref:DNA methyltransferase n=1 Tax=Streptococcus sp. 5004 TaxID=2582670 RepID=UPI00156469F8